MNNLPYSDSNQTELQNKGTTPEDKFKRSREVLKQTLFHLYSSQTHMLVYFCSPVNSFTSEEQYRDYTQSETDISDLSCQCSFPWATGSVWSPDTDV